MKTESYCARFARAHGNAPFEVETAHEWKAFQLGYRNAPDDVCARANERESALGPNSPDVAYHRILNWATGWTDVVFVRVLADGKPTALSAVAKGWHSLK